MTTSITPLPRSHAWKTIACAGLFAGALDLADAILYFGLRFGVSPRRIFTHIASGLIGPRAAAHNPAASAVLGLLLHFFIACAAAAVFYCAAQLLPSMLQRPYTFGTLFGLVWYGFMYSVVIPLSAIPSNPNERFSFPSVANEILAHVFLVGIPIVLIVRRSALVRRGHAAVSG